MNEPTSGLDPGPSRVCGNSRGRTAPAVARQGGDADQADAERRWPPGHCPRPPASPGHHHDHSRQAQQAILRNAFAVPPVPATGPGPDPLECSGRGSHGGALGAQRCRRWPISSGMKGGQGRTNLCPANPFLRGRSPPKVPVLATRQHQQPTPPGAGHPVNRLLWK